VIAGSAQQLFPDDAGALCSIDRSDAGLEVVARWGKPFAFPVSAPTHCLALGEVGEADRRAQGCRACYRRAPTAAAAQTCFPVSSRHGPTSIVCFRWQPITPASGRDASSIGRLQVEQATAFVKQIGLALTSVRLKEQLREQTLRDPLTGLHNRRFLEEVFPRDLLRAARNQEPVGILMLDLDDFKAFNDAHGHPAGDTLLKAAAARIQSLVRAADVACRYGGEEFILILPDATVDDASARAEQIRAAIGELTIDIDGVPTPSVTISIGVAASPRNGESAAALVRAADSALYAAKSNGRNRTEVAIPVLTTTPSRHSSTRGPTNAPRPASVLSRT
jgi:diguanylate cyclase (GGDEF)-like protein